MIRPRPLGFPLVFSGCLAVLALGFGGLRAGQAAPATSPSNAAAQSDLTDDSTIEQDAATEWMPARQKAATATSPPAGNPQRQSPPTALAAPGWAPAPTYQSAAPAISKATKATAPQSPTPPTAQWRLPNGKPFSGTAQPAKQSTATATKGSTSAAIPAARRPRDFQPAENARPLTAATADNRSASKSAPRTPPVANHGASASVRAARPTIAATGMANNSAAHHTPRAPLHEEPRQSRPRRLGNMGPSNKPLPAKIWNSITVAFEGPDQWTGEPESLPLPGPGSAVSPPGRVPEGIVAGDGSYGESSEGYYVPYDQGGADACGNGGCCECGDGVCEPGCPCGCGGEVGCGCEPGCGCSSGNSKDLFCLGYGDDESCHTIRVRLPKWQELMVFGGVQGFKGPYDQARDSGNFGFHEGFNSGWKVPFTDVGYQIGYRAVHSQLNGDKDTNIADPHTQQFVTAGFFQRSKDGIQLGIVWDMLHDERFDAVDFHQLRGELSLMDHGCHEIGISAAVHLNERERFPANVEQSSVVYQASDQYLLFYRFHGARGGEGRFYGGINDDDDVIIGADMLIPLQDRWSLATGFTYLIPDEHSGQDGAAQEAWNIGTALVWHWDCRARKCHSNCYRPLFNVADNGYLIVDERRGN